MTRHMNDLADRLTAPYQVAAAAPDEDPTDSLDQLLGRLGLSDYLDTFNKEQVDLDTLVIL